MDNTLPDDVKENIYHEAEKYWQREINKFLIAGIKVHPDSGQKDKLGFAAGARFGYSLSQQ